MDKYLCCKDYVDFKKEVLDPLKESIKETSMELKKSKRIINTLKLNLEIVPYLDDIENELPDNNEYDIFCEGIPLELDKEVRECELNKYRIEERKIPYWDFKDLFYVRRRENKRA